MVTRSTSMTWKVMSTTARRRRSRSSSAVSFWATSRSSDSFFACRSSAVAAATRSWPRLSGPSRLVIPAGPPPLTTSLRTISPLGWDGSGSGPAPAGLISVSLYVTLPKVTESLAMSRPVATRLPLMQVPLELPRSSTSTTSSRAVSSAWRREMVGS